APQSQHYPAQIQQMLMQKTVEGLISLATNREADGRVREAAHNGLMTIKKKYRYTDPEHPGYLRLMIQQYEQNPQIPQSTTALAAPDGAPIDPGQEWLEGCEWEK
ncbi:MAG: peptidase, partial [Rudanella sp.]|nr:peptidase [Rudanella sp.]